MSDPTEIPEDEILPEYSLNSGVRGKYAARYAAGTNLDRLEAKLTAESPDSNPVNDASRGRLLLVIAFAGALLCGACLPIANTVTLSPAIEGTYRHEDGTPVAGAPLALSTAHDDSTCATPSLRTTTDAAGRFAFPATRQRERFTAVLFERLLGYAICGGEAGTSPLYGTNYLHSMPDSASVTCIQLAVPEPTTSRRTSCTSSRRPRRRAARR